MRTTNLLPVVSFVPAILFPLLPALPAQGVPSWRASADAAGVPGNDDSVQPALSADGRFVAFHSKAANLVAGDTNGVDDVFVRDRITGKIERVSVRTGGGQGNQRSYDAAITADGRYVAFTSRATNLTTIDGSSSDVFVHDRQSGTTEIVSVSSLGIPGTDDSGSPSISDDGRYVAFGSKASNLVTGDGNGFADVFVHDRKNKTTLRASVAMGVLQPDGGSQTPKISPDGRRVAFSSGATNLVPGDTNRLIDVFVRDLVTATTTRASVGVGGAEPDGTSHIGAISTLGTEVAFYSFATNLVAGDTNARPDVFVASHDGASCVRVSVASDGTQADEGCFDPAMSRDGRFVAFTTRARTLAVGDSLGLEDVYLCDRTAGTTRRATQTPGGGEPRGDCARGAISDDGRWLAFDSAALNLVPGRTVVIEDVFVSDLRPAVAARFAAYGAGCRGSRGIPALGRDPDTLPWIGTALRVRVTDAVALRPCWLSIGASKTSWGGIPLPLPLDGAGMPGCVVLASPDLSLALATDAAGALEVPLMVPADARFLGASIHLQAWIADAAANAFGLVVTNAATATLGGS